MSRKLYVNSGDLLTDHCALRVEVPLSADTQKRTQENVKGTCCSDSFNHNSVRRVAATCPIAPF